MVIPPVLRGGVAIVSAEGNGSRPSHRGPGFSEEAVSYTLNEVDRHAVCYEAVKDLILPIENHAMDSRVKVSEDGIVQTLPSRMGTGGGQRTARPSGGNVEGFVDGSVSASRLSRE